MARRLSVIDGSDVGLELELGDQPVTVGKHESRDMALQDDRVSRMHFSVEVRGEETIVRDEGSTNGTFLNGESITEAVMHTGDCILAGSTVVMYESDAEAPAEEDVVRIEVPGGPPVDQRAPTDDMSSGSISLDDDEGSIGIGIPEPTEGRNTDAQGTVIFTPKPPQGHSGATKTVLVPPKPGPMQAPPRMPTGVMTEVLMPGTPPSAGGRRTDVTPVITEALDSAKPLGERAGIGIDVDIAPGATMGINPNLVYPLLAQSLYACLNPSAPFSPTAMHVGVRRSDGALVIAIDGEPAPGMRAALAAALAAAPLNGMVAALQQAGGRVETTKPDVRGARVLALRLP